MDRKQTVKDEIAWRKDLRTVFGEEVYGPDDEEKEYMEELDRIETSERRDRQSRNSDLDIGGGGW